MTANQIEFAKHGETRRHNQVTEAQGWRDVDTRSRQADAAMQQAVAATQQAGVAAQRLKEESRHNAEQERINWWSTERSQKEVERANAEKEKQQWVAITTLADLQAKQGDAVQRQAAVAESDAVSKRLQAQASQIQAGAASRQASASMLNAQTQQSALAESIRHNLELEQMQGFSLLETQRHNTASEEELNRANLVKEEQNQESLIYKRMGLNYDKKQADAAYLRAKAQMLSAGTKFGSELAGSIAKIIGGLQ